MVVLALKLILAPAFVVGASLVGLISLAAFVVAYGVTAQRRGWPVALLVAWSAFLGLTALFALLTSAVHVPSTLGLAAAFMSFFAARPLLPRDGARPRDGRAQAPPAPPSWDLPVRALCAAAMVLAVTAASSGLGARVSGLLAPSPIITSVLAAFTQAQAGPDTTLRLLRGMLTGFFSFALFCWTIAVLLPHAALGVTFAAAVGVAALTQVAIARGESIGSRPYSR